MISGRPHTLARLNLSPNRCMSPIVHRRPIRSGKSASSDSLSRRIIKAVRMPTRMNANAVPCM
jgi:hypothetical protein